MCTNSYVRCAHRPAGLCTPTCSAHRPAQHTDPLCMQIFTAHQPACLLLSFRSKLPKIFFLCFALCAPKCLESFAQNLVYIFDKQSPWMNPAMRIMSRIRRMGRDATTCPAFVWPINIRFFFCSVVAAHIAPPAPPSRAC